MTLATSGRRRGGVGGGGIGVGSAGNAGAGITSVGSTGRTMVASSPGHGVRLPGVEATVNGSAFVSLYDSVTAVPGVLRVRVLRGAVGESMRRPARVSGPVRDE
jgi:hypothetical protein